MPAKIRWELTKESLETLLGHLDADRDRAAARYETLRAGLVRFFEWRGCSFPAEHADETLDRVARKIGEGEPIQDVHAYAVGVARFRFKEIVKERVGQRAALDQLPLETAPEDVRLECIRRCLDSLPAEDARLLVSYYRHDRAEKIERRRTLARELGIGLPALRMRLQRLRARLEACAVDCVGTKGP